ncbi:hypothetical protein [Arthrobacter sp. B3I4]|uniref:hypothetical protein n=1 Tax=Arthrobacter sp. B3I4 TaxID=3042267 RepID=UPI002782C897|nr:hypothetical protein [Arthrobacter sp. B3I4]MDQ0755770.1 hypothetical protein [Arthrobacter sp. B3I4]
MPWTKLTDEYSDQTHRLSHEAYRLHTDAIIWCNRAWLDMKLPKKDLSRFKDGIGLEPAVIAELTDGPVPYWEDSGTYYTILHTKDHQRTAEDVLRQSAANKRNGKQGGRPRKDRQNIRQHQYYDKAVETDSLTESQTNSETETRSKPEKGVFTTKLPDAPDIPVSPQEQNPFANRIENQKGLALKGSPSPATSNQKAALKESAPQPAPLDRDALPVDDPGLKYRAAAEETGVETVEALAAKPGWTQEKARFALSLAFPGREF